MSDLREQIAERIAARRPRPRHGQRCPVWRGRAQGVEITSCDCWIIREARGDADAVMRVIEGETLAGQLQQAEARLAELEGALTWQTSCTSCAKVLDSSYAETQRAEQAEARLERAAAETRRLLDYATPDARAVLQRVLATLAPAKEQP